MAFYLKKSFKDIEVLFIGKSYTRAIIEACKNIDRFIDWDELSKGGSTEIVDTIKNTAADSIIHVFPNRAIARAARRAGVVQRIGTSHRWFHHTTCNTLVHFSRKQSDLHESQLNFKLLQPLGIYTTPLLPEIAGMYGLDFSGYPLPLHRLGIDPHKPTLVIHPLSKGSSRDWGLDNWAEFIHILPEETYNIVITGSADEGETLRPLLTEPYAEKVIDTTGRLTLQELCSLISHADALVACSTGPLHIAAAAGTAALGLFPPMRPIHPGRWQPVGENAGYLVKPITCNSCRKSDVCECIRSITPEEVLEKLLLMLTTADHRR